MLWKPFYTSAYFIIQMDKKLATLQNFFEDPTGEFHIREIAKLAGINHMTARSYLNLFVKERLLKKKETKLYATYSANPDDKKFLNLKRYYNLEKIRLSNIVEELEKFYDYPVIVLFGSYSSATNTKDSDIDLFVLTNIKKKFKLDKYETALNRKISLHIFSEKEFQNMKIKNSELINNICNGIVLSGKLEVI